MCCFFGDASDSRMSEDDSPQARRALADKAAAMYREQGISITSIAVGDGDDASFLKSLAESSGGQFFQTSDATTLPMLFSEASAGFVGGYIQEDRFRTSLVQEGELTLDFDFEHAPPIHGLVQFEEREDASVWLEAAAEYTFPLLVTRRVGLGRSMAFASDMRSRWAKDWMGWEDAAPAFQRWFRWLSSGTRAGVADLEFDQQGDWLNARLFHRKQQGGQISAILTTPGAESQTLSLSPLNPNFSALRLRLKESGLHRLHFVYQHDSTIESLGTAWFLRAALEESKDHTQTRQALQKLSASMGGGFVDSVQSALSQRPRKRVRLVSAHDVPAWCALAALFLLVSARRFSLGLWFRQQRQAPGLNQHDCLTGRSPSARRIATRSGSQSRG